MKDHTATIPMEEYQELMRLKQKQIDIRKEQDAIRKEYNKVVISLFGYLKSDYLADVNKGLNVDLYTGKYSLRFKRESNVLGGGVTVTIIKHEKDS